MLDGLALRRDEPSRYFTLDMVYHILLVLIPTDKSTYIMLRISRMVTFASLQEVLFLRKSLKRENLYGSVQKYGLLVG